MKNVSSPWTGPAAWSAACIAIGLCATAALAAPPDSSLTGSPASSAQADAGEPRADTSAPAGNANGTAAASATAGTAGSGTASAGGSGTAGAGGSGTAGAGARGIAGAGGSPAANGSPRTGAASSTAKPGAQKAPGAADRVDLGTATVTGDREQPKVMYVVPWKTSDIGDLSGKPMNSLLDEALAPVDRDEFKREVAYFDAVKADRSQNGTPKPAADQGEK